MAWQSLYRRVLGARFDALPDVLRRFHDTPGGGRARGTLQVTRPGGRLRNALAACLGLPDAGADVPVRLDIEVVGERERWVRRIQGRRLATIQWARGDLLMESYGPTAFACALVVEGSCLRYDFRRAWVMGIPLPRWLAPYVDGQVMAGEGGWRTSVRVNAPWFGELVHYEGWIEPE